jgi:hypothetical protein
MGPEWIDPLPYAPSPTLVAHAQDRPLNNMQRALVALAANLPNAAIEADAKSIALHVEGIQTGGQASPPANITTNVRDAAAYVKQRLGQFFKAAGTD